MSNASSYRRPALVHRPWLTGKQYDDYSRASVLHCDAYVLDVGSFKVLEIDWREGGRKQVACDAYLIEPDGLTPLWDAGWRVRASVPVYWTRANGSWMERLHARVVMEVAKARESGRWATVTLQAHYVHAPDRDPWGGAPNRYKAPKRRAGTSVLPDLL